jgi:polysaccharide export outer membrane protein
MAALALPRLFSFFALAACALLTAACTSGPAPVASNPRIPDATSAALLRAGDSLVVSIQGVPDPSTNAVQIDDQGIISLPLIGVVNAAGLTPSDLSQRVRETYVSKRIYTTVDISVSVTERYVYVGGEVQRPGRIVWTPDLTVTKAIQAAGGFTLYARETGVSLVREQTAYPFNVTLAQRDPAEDLRMMPGDSIQVPRSAF